MPTTPSPNDLAAKARFVFRGTVQKLNASTLPEVHDTSKTAVVRVDATVQAPKTLSHYTGKDITVRVDDPGELKVGQEAVFFADAWLFGHAGVAVRSLGFHLPGPQTAALLAPASDPVTNLEDRDTQAHYDAADMVVSGRVLSVALPADTKEARGPREHQPDWREAVVEIDQVHKGDTKEKKVLVRFPASHDRTWYHAPKLQVGQQGYFLLHRPAPAVERQAISGPQGAAGEYYTVLHSEDFEPKDRPGRIRKLLNRLRDTRSH